MGQAPYLPRGLSHIKDNNHSTTTVLNPKRPPIKRVITQEDEDLSTTIVLDKEGSFVHKTIKNLDYHGTRTTMTHENRLPQYSKKQIKIANDIGNQPIGRQLKRKYYTSECRKYCSGHTSTQDPKEYYNKCSSLSFRRRLQTTDNLISDGLHLRDIFREFLL